METGNEVFGYMDECIARKRCLGKESTADLYRAGGNWLKAFCGSGVLRWEDITEDLVDGFDTYLKGLGLKTNSRNSYLSNVRAMYNSAVKDRLSTPLYNPFSHLKLKREATEKRSLPPDLTGRIARTDLSGSPQLRQAVDLYMFSYLACGMPFVDMALLTPANIRGDRLVYHRAKNGVKVTVCISAGMRAIIDRYHRDGALRLFPILPDTEEVLHETYKRCLRHDNGCLKEVSAMLGLGVVLTTYYPRHSWASDAYELDIPIAVISQALGHTSERTTRIYLAALSQEKMSDANRKVTGWADNIICGYS